MVLVFSEECLDYGISKHPESPERLRMLHEDLRDDFTFVGPSQVKESDLFLVHTPELVSTIEKRAFYDHDSPAYPDIFHYAKISVGCALRAMELNGFSLSRPPGHHAGRNFLGGFCYFNNVAIAVRRSGLRTLIVDFDAHHGNGTQDIFLDDPNVTYISLHCTGFFPGSGTKSEKNAYNHHVPYNCKDREYLTILENALEVVCDKRYEQLAVSAGFDGHEHDPVASLGLSVQVYKQIGKMLKELGLPSFTVLEGGYDPKDLRKNILSYLEGIM